VFDQEETCPDAGSVRFPIRRDGDSWPVMSQSFANHYVDGQGIDHGYHDGEDWVTNAEPYAVHPVAAGEVVHVGPISSTPKDDGWLVVVRHTGSFDVRATTTDGEPAGIGRHTQFWLSSDTRISTCTDTRPPRRRTRDLHVGGPLMSR
jgi:hypothetical protein